MTSRTHFSVIDVVHAGVTAWSLVVGTMIHSGGVVDVQWDRGFGG